MHPEMPDVAKGKGCNFSSSQQSFGRISGGELKGRKRETRPANILAFLYYAH